MKFVIITKESDIAAAAKSPSAFPPTDEVVVFEDWRKALDACEGADMLIVDLLATLDEPNKIAGYERFAQAKLEHSKAAPVPVVLIKEPEDYELDFMAGIPDFLFAYIRRPVTDKIFRRASTWV